MPLLALLTLLVLCVTPSGAVRAQHDTGLNGREPRFYAMMSARREPEQISATKMPALARRIAVELDNVTLDEALRTIANDREEKSRSRHRRVDRRHGKVSPARDRLSRRRARARHDPAERRPGVCGARHQLGSAAAEGEGEDAAEEGCRCCGADRAAEAYDGGLHDLRASLRVVELYCRAQECEVVPVGYNPVASLMEKLAVVQAEARWLEVPDAALLLESARTLPTVVTPAGEGISVQLAYPLVAAYLLGRGREQEVRGLELDDVSFDSKTITFRPNDWRRLKTQTSWRVVPLWPQLEEILRAYVFGAPASRGRLLFPTFVDGRETMLADTRKLLDRIGGRVGWKKGEIRCRLFRHTYCAKR